MIDSDDIEFMQIAADALGFSDAEYRALLNEVDSWEEESEYDLDPSWPDDDWLDAGEEWEIAPESMED